MVINKYLYYTFVPVLVLVLALLAPNIGHHRREVRHTAGQDTIVYALGNHRNDYYIARAEPVGYQLEMIRAFARSQQRPYRIERLPAAAARKQALLENRVAIIVCAPDELNTVLTADNAVVSIRLPDNSAWIVPTGNKELISLLVHWIAQFRQTKNYKFIEQKYLYASYTPQHRTLYTTLSPYDELIKKYARSTGIGGCWLL